MLPVTSIHPCPHCGTATEGAPDAFCCHGCEAASALVSGLGLDAFYRRRRAAPGLWLAQP